MKGLRVSICQLTILLIQLLNNQNSLIRKFVIKYFFNYQGSNQLVTIFLFIQNKKNFNLKVKLEKIHYY